MTATAATDVTDEQLVALAADGDTGAFNQLVVRWERPIFALAYRTLGRERGGRARCLPGGVPAGVLQDDFSDALAAKLKGRLLGVGTHRS